MIDDLLGRLEKVRQTGRGQWVAACPSHADRSPSLSIRDTGERTLIFCHAGCGAADVLDALGLDFGCLFPDPPAGRQGRGPLRRPGPDYRTALQLLDRDALAVAIAAETLARGGPLNEQDRDYLAAAAVRIGRLRGMST